MQRETHRKNNGSSPRAGKAALLAIIAAVLLIVCVTVTLFLRPATVVTASSDTISYGVPVLSPDGGVPSSSPASIIQAENGFYFTEEEIAALDAMLDEWAAQREEEDDDGHTVAVYFKDIESGIEYIYCPDARLEIASLNKAPYAIYMYTLVDAGKASLDDKILVTREMLGTSLENSGRIKDDSALPREYTIAELLEHMLRYSDTAALRILIQQYGTSGYIDYVKSLGIRYPEDLKEVTNGYIRAEDAGVYLAEMYRYMQDGAHGEELKTHLSNTTNPMIRSEYPVVHKYGWDAKAFHDMAVVYAPQPYLLAILTNKSAGTMAEYEMFATIASTIEEMMDNKRINA